MNLYQTDAANRDASQILSPDQHILNPSIPLSERVSSINESSTTSQLEHSNVEMASTLAPLIHRLDALLMVLKTCKGRQCTHPWETLFPEGNVKSLSDALDVEYDNYFNKELERVRFDRCEKGYIAESEGPMWKDQVAYFMTEETAYE